MAKKLISIIVPVYRNQGTLETTYINLKGILKDYAGKYDHEFIFINDGSDDSSLAELIKIRKIDKSVKIINFTKNFGQLSAIFAGFKYAKGDALMHISADLQDPVSLIPEMMNKWNEGYKIVAGERAGREDNFFARITSKVFYSLIKISIPKMPIGGFDFYLVDKAIYKELLKFCGRNSFLQGDLLQFGYEPYFIKYKRMKRKIGKSQWSFPKKIKYFIDGVINTSYLPIRLISYVGLLTSILGFIYAILVFFLRIFNNTPFIGYAPLMIIMLLTSGLIMCMLGIIGEYLWRIYDEIKKNPKYVIEKIYE